MMAAYASIPYKTPWCLLGFLHGLILLAGVGANLLLSSPRRAAARLAVGALVAAGAVHLGWQAWAGSSRYAADPRNPYVYAHTSTDVFEIARRVEGLARAHPQRERMPVEVLSRENLWPLPWYLRRLRDVRWETTPVKDAGPAPLILATPDMEDAVRRKLYDWRPAGERELYVPAFDTEVELRPRVEVLGYAAWSLWESYRQSAGDSSPPAGGNR
jgi:predicted membrane-bound mannosyltransferase